MATVQRYEVSGCCYNFCNGLYLARDGNADEFQHATKDCRLSRIPLHFTEGQRCDGYWEISFGQPGIVLYYSSADTGRPDINWVVSENTNTFTWRNPFTNLRVTPADNDFYSSRDQGPQSTHPSTQRLALGHATLTAAASELDKWPVQRPGQAPPLDMITHGSVPPTPSEAPAAAPVASSEADEHSAESHSVSSSKSLIAVAPTVDDHFGKEGVAPLPPPRIPSADSDGSPPKRPQFPPEWKSDSSSGGSAYFTKRRTHKQRHAKTYDTRKHVPEVRSSTIVGNTMAMKVHGMYQMVEDTELVFRGYNYYKKVLYLTEEECRLFDTDAVERCLQTLDLTEHKCVILLLPGTHGVAYYEVHHHSDAASATLQFGSYIDAHDAGRTGSQLDQFIETCILPLAKQTHALIICSGCNDDELSTSLDRVIVPEQARLGKNCPFKVVSFVWSFKIQFSASNGVGIAGAVARQCKRWRDRLAAADAHMAHLEVIEVERCDLINAATRIIVFESYNDKQGWADLARILQAQLIGRMTSKRPSFAIQILHCEYSAPADLILREIPVLFLNMHERTIAAVLGGVGKITPPPITHLAEILTSRFASEFYPECGQERLHLAFRIIESQINTLASRNIVDFDNASAVALIHEALTYSIHNTDHAADGSHVSLCERIKELEEDPDSIKGSSHVPVELAREAAEFLHLMMRVDPRNHAAPVSSRPESTGSTEELLHIRRLLCSSRTFSGCIYDLKSLNRIVLDILQLDRPPKSNSLAALLVLQDAWDHIGAYQHDADFYKIVTKLSYALLLLGGIATSVVAIRSVGRVEGTPVGQYALLAVSLVSTAVGSYVNFMSPAQLWQQYRGAAISMESEIWLFRARAGDYRPRAESKNDFKNADTLLHDRILAIKQEVLESGNIKRTSFFGKLRTGNFTRPPAISRLSHTDDNHHSPLQSDEYVALRIAKETRFYKQRIMPNSYVRQIGQFVSTVGSIATIILAFLNAIEWTVVIAVFVAGIFSWLEFQDTINKIERYSSVVDALQNLVLWWNTCSRSEQSAPEYVDRLVGDTEEILINELAAWRFSSTSSRKLLENKAGRPKPIPGGGVGAAEPV